MANGTPQALDFANSAAADPIFTVTDGPLVSNGTVSSSVGTARASPPAATLALAGKSGQTNSQTFGALTRAVEATTPIAFNPERRYRLNLTTGVITNTLGGTDRGDAPNGGDVHHFANTNTASTPRPPRGRGAALLYVIVGGTEWGALSGTSLVAGSTASGSSFYTANTATALTEQASNADLDHLRRLERREHVGRQLAPQHRLRLDPQPRERTPW